MRKVIRIAAYLLELFAAYICAFFIKCFFSDMRGIWIVSERGIDARDNGYFFFKYMRELHPERKVYYIIKKESADYPKVCVLGNVIEHESFKHYLFYALCEVRISSSLWGGDLPKCDYMKKMRRHMCRKKKFVFLKHGIIKDYLPQHCYGEGYPDIYVCGAKPEFDYVKENFLYPEGVVRYLGLARFDNLHEFHTKPQILFMPTFRKWLQGKSEAELRDSEYVKMWNAVIQDERIIRLLEDNNLELIFYPHIVLQKNVHLFSSNSSVVKIASFQVYDVQTLLKESKLLVTDYSSVFFDFAYMEKPVVYFQFDRERYVKEHYDFTKGYFSYDRDGFGEVVFDHETLIHSLADCIQNNFLLEDLYKRRLKNFFVLKDKHNCERIYSEIEKMT